MKYICPAAKTCKTIGCGCRVAHARERNKDGNHRMWVCSAIYSTIDGKLLCPACEPVEGEYEDYLQSISERCGVVPPDKLY